MKVRAHAALSAKSPLEPFEYDVGPLGPQQVDVRVTHCGICHTDSAMVDNDYGVTQYPLVPGHEAAGVVAAVGAEVDRLRVGQRVGVGPMCGSCMACEWCEGGLQHLCPNVRRPDRVRERHGRDARVHRPARDHADHRDVCDDRRQPRVGTHSGRQGSLPRRPCHLTVGHPREDGPTGTPSNLGRLLLLAAATAPAVCRHVIGLGLWIAPAVAYPLDSATSVKKDPACEAMAPRHSLRRPVIHSHTLQRSAPGDDLIQHGVDGCLMTATWLEGRKALKVGVER